jgi:hypothetical protein
MAYEDELKAVVAANLDEIQGDLEKARLALRRADDDARELRQTVANLESLLATVDQPAKHAPAAEMTLHDAMALVLKETPGGLRRAVDLAAEVNRRRLYTMQDGRPVEPQQIHARVNNYSHMFVKEGTFIRLRRPDERA